ncbi:uncharacterized protein LOC142750859 isoform X2 [Rhinoderma darwinii]|uniref:uncharacterized protein LOC142750859 isoform X2 n=1 Tax=Rhinoderma darwinii TaxID=43563 RepID=UPI003F67B951
MLFRLLLIVNVLLASVEGAPIDIRRYDSGARNRISTDIRGDLLYGPCSKTCGIGIRVVYVTKGCPDQKDKCFFRMEQCQGPQDCGVHTTTPAPPIPFWNKFIVTSAASTVISLLKNKYVAAAAGSVVAIFILGMFFSLIHYIRYKKSMKKKSKRDVETQCTIDESRESSDQINDKHQDKINIINDDSSHGLAENIDIIKDIKTSMTGPNDVTINISPEDVDTASDITDDGSHGLAENRDLIEDTKTSMTGPNDVTINISPEEVDTTKIITDDASHGLAENRDLIKYTKLSMPGSNDDTINISPEDVDTASDITTDDAPHGLAETRDVIEDTKISMPGSNDVTISISPEDVDTASDIITDDAPHGLAENRDPIKDTKISMPGSNEDAINISPEDVDTTSDITNDASHGPAETRDVIKDTKISMPGSKDVSINISPYHVDTSSDKQQEDKEHLQHLPSAEKHLGQNKEGVGFNASKTNTFTDSASYSSPMQELHKHLLAYFEKAASSPK